MSEPWLAYCLQVYGAPAQRGCKSIHLLVHRGLKLAAKQDDLGSTSWSSSKQYPGVLVNCWIHPPRINGQVPGIVELPEFLDEEYCPSL